MTAATKAMVAAAALAVAAPSYRRGDGDVLDLPAPEGGVEANRFYRVGGLVVHAGATAKAGVNFAAFPSGLYADAPKAEGEAWEAGQALHFDGSAFASKGSGAPVAHAVRSAEEGDTTGTIRLKN